MPMGAPGWPELAFPVMSTAKQRIVLMHFQSSSPEGLAMVETIRRNWIGYILIENIPEREVVKKRLYPRGLS